MGRAGWGERKEIGDAPEVEELASDEDPVGGQGKRADREREAKRAEEVRMERGEREEVEGRY